MAAPIQMTSETLNALKGWPNLAAVDFEAKLDPTIVDRVPPGAVVHVGPALTFLLGVGDVPVMPLFTFFASDDPGIVNDGGDPAVDKGVWIGINPSGVMMALPACGSYELVSTHYDPSQSYLPNDHLTSPLAPDGDVPAGMITKGDVGTDTICGVVSRGVVDNGYGTLAIAFWPVYLPVGA